MRCNKQNYQRRSQKHEKLQPLRQAAVAVEAAIVLPLLLLLFVASVDFARVFRDMQVIAECARLGAVHAADPDLAARSEFETVESIALAGAINLSPKPTFSVVYGKDSQGDQYAEVTVNHSFRLITSFLGSKPLTLSRTARARFRPGALD